MLDRLQIGSIKIFPEGNNKVFGYNSVVECRFTITNTMSIDLEGTLFWAFGYMDGTTFKTLRGQYSFAITTLQVENYPMERLREYKISYTIPGTITPRTTYCFKLCTSCNHPITERIYVSDVAYSPIFEVKQYSEECKLYQFSIVSPNVAFKINHNLLTGFAQVPSGTTVTTLVGVFVMSQNATASVGGNPITSNSTPINFTSAVTVRVTAEDGTTYQDYVLTLSIADISWSGNSHLVVWSTGPATYITPNPCYIGENIKLQVEISNASTDTDYPANGGLIAYVKLWDIANQEYILLPQAHIYLTKVIPKKVGGLLSYIPFSVTFKLDDFTPYGTTYGDTHLRITIPNTSNSQCDIPIQINKYRNNIRTLAYSQKLNSFQGERDYESTMMVSLNNSFYSSWDLSEELGTNGLKQVKFFLQDVDGMTGLYQDLDGTTWRNGKDLHWQLEFYVNNPLQQVIFQSLVIEAGKLLGGEIEIESIEYKTAKYSVLQEPFYDDYVDPITGISREWELPWQPVWKNDKWYLSIQNAIDTSTLIESQKLKGMWLKITLKGPSTDPIFIRSVVTKIANLFN